MSGFGERFRKEGYNVPKPLIEVEGKTFVQHVYELFDDKDDFIFICNQEHLNNESFKMEEIIQSFCPKGRIVGIKPHKLGPIHAVNQILGEYSENKEVIINYCDFTCYWDYNNFLKRVRNSEVIGAIPANKGFHPHSDGKTNYAYIKENDLIATDIQEKKPFTSDKTNEYASSGTYYFKSIKILRDSISYVLENNIHTNGEYYVSMCYKYLFNNNLPVLVYPLEHFMQWGTPQDFEEYCFQSRIFRKLIEPKATLPINSELVIPMAGLGQRFKKEGYQKIKPLIEVSGKPMIIQALKTLPKFNSYDLIINESLEGKREIKTMISDTFNKVQFTEIEKPTNGQATTIKKGIDTFQDNQKISVISCDNGFIISNNELEKINSDNYDILVWGASNYPYAKTNPNSYGWVYHEENIIKDVSVKKIKESNYQASVITGGFSFRTKSIFNKCYSSLVSNYNLVNGEFYADSLIEEALKLKLNCVLLNVDCYISWGTPKELKTFNYWQSCFHKWHSHPYRMEIDNIFGRR